jgi:hypothetical protein
VADEPAPTKYSQASESLAGEIDYEHGMEEKEAAQELRE